MPKGFVVKVGHRDISVSALSPTKARDMEADGIYSPSRRAIEIDPNLTPPDQAETLIHEILHALWHYMGLPEKAPEERVVEALSLGLATVLRDNPELHAMIHQALLSKRGLPL